MSDLKSQTARGLSFLCLILISTGVLAQQVAPPVLNCTDRGGSGARLVIAGAAFNRYQDVYYVGDELFLQVANGNTNSVVPADYSIFENVRFRPAETIQFGEKTFLSFNAVEPGFYRIEASATVDQAPQSCWLEAEVFEVLTASIGSITGLRQNGSQLSFAGVVRGGAGALTYFWDFGDGATSSSRSPSHIYNAPGVYTVRFVVSDQFGMSRESVQSIQISSNPNVPGQPSTGFQEFTGCGFGQPSYVFTWTPGGLQPSNYYQFQFKPKNSSNWGFKYTQTDNQRVLSNLLSNFNYDWRVRGCLTSADSTCGPYFEKTFRTRSCSTGGGGTQPF